jgi:adenine C2-methylase RlmN of 23S rRNA A2503 and tRNA A37
MINQSVYSLTSENWKELLLFNEVSAQVLPFWLDGLYKDRSLWQRHVSKKLLETFRLQFDFSLPEISMVQESDDGTIKFLIRFEDKLEVETVVIPFHKR